MLSGAISGVSPTVGPGTLGGALVSRETWLLLAKQPRPLLPALSYQG